MRPTLPPWAWVAIAVAVTWFLFVASAVISFSVVYLGWSHHYSGLLDL